MYTSNTTADYGMVVGTRQKGTTFLLELKVPVSSSSVGGIVLFMIEVRREWPDRLFKLKGGGMVTQIAMALYNHDEQQSFSEHTQLLVDGLQQQILSLSCEPRK